MGKSPSSSPAPGPEHRVVLLYGANAFLAAEHTSALREKLTAVHGEVDSLTFDGTSARLADVLDECRSMGLMHQHKLVVVDDAHELVKGDNRPLVERYAQAPAPDATLVLRSSDWKGGKLDVMISAVGIRVECGRVSEVSAINWVIKRAPKRHQATIEHDAAEALVERCGADLGMLDSHLAKLASGVGATGVITKASVGEIVGRTREESAWDWQGAVLTGSARDSVEQLRYLLDVSREPAQLLWWACLDLARKLDGGAHGLAAGTNPGQVGTALRLWGPASKMFLETAARIGPVKAHRIMSLAVRGDLGSKSGLGHAERNLEVATLQIAHILAES